MSETLTHSKLFRPKRAINRKTKKHLVFDANARKEFLTGFHKRKLQRKKKAQEELIQQIKEEKKRIKEEARNLHKTLVVSHRPIPELAAQEAAEEEEEGETFDFPEHSVTVRDLSTTAVAEEPAAPSQEAQAQPSGKEVQRAMRQLVARQAKNSKVLARQGRLQRSKSRKQNARTKKKMESKRNRHKHPNKRDKDAA